MNAQPMPLTIDLARKLIAEQFSEYSNMSITEVKKQGHDNRTYRLGEEMLIRLPSAEEYVRQVEKEHNWLPLLGPHLAFSIPEPIAIGQPSKDYPWNWSIYRWLDGESANSLTLDDKTLENIVSDLTKFLKELHKVDISGAPGAGLHNFFRGSHTSFYDKDVRKYIKELECFIDGKAAMFLWDKAISSTWNKDPVWVHGDVASGNILVKDNHLSAVIDFGCMGIGDPACDLTIAWTFFKNESRRIFKQHMDLDDDTWDRARGWALWKALYELSQLQDKLSLEALKQKTIINDVLSE